MNPKSKQHFNKRDSSCNLIQYQCWTTHLRNEAQLQKLLLEIRTYQKNQRNKGSIEAPGHKQADNPLETEYKA